MYEALPTTGAVSDPELLAFLAHRLKRTAEEFSLDREGWPSRTMLYWREGRPVRQIIPGNPTGCLIYLTKGADMSNAFHQIAHEVTHSVLLPNHVAFEWVQEMFAQHVAIRALIEIGQQQFAEVVMDHLSEEAETVTLTTEAMLAADLETENVAGIYPSPSWSGWN